MDKQNESKRLKNLSSAAGHFKSDTQVVKLDFALEVVDAIDQLDEPEKVVVPDFVAEWIEKYKPMNSLRVAFIYIYELPREDKFKIWIENGMSETFARAWLDGYTVGKEKTYRVLDKEGCVLIRRYGETVRRVTSKVEPNQYPESERGVLALTEQEIKEYDERYFAFREEVTD